MLLEYFPASGVALDADLAASLARVPDGTKKDAGVAIGAAAAAAMIASRVGDGRNDTSIVYSKAPALGVWQPPPTGMAPAVARLRGPRRRRATGGRRRPRPDHERGLRRGLRGGAHARVRSPGPTGPPSRRPIALFFGGNPVLTYRNALCDLLDAEPLGLLPTTRLLARIDAAVANSFIQTWRLKFEVGFWRPFQAIAAAAIDGNPGTNPHPVAWASLVPTPAYSEYTSGHAAATSPFAEVLRRTLGDDTPLVLRSGGVTRTYDSLSALEFDAFHARIWGGLHFRRAMEDGYQLGHTTAGRVIDTVH